MAQPVLNHDLPCYRCAYNLRGLARSHQCPECGFYIADSIERFVKFAATGKDARRLNRFDKVCAVMAVALGVIFLLLGVVGLFVGCQANFTLPPLVGALPALIGWGILRSVRIAWGSGHRDAEVRRSMVNTPSIYRDPIPTLPEDIDTEIDRLGQPLNPDPP